jgi:hypothetical protein
MFRLLEVCYTTGGICPHKEEVVPRCVTEGFCGGRHGPLTGIEAMQWKPLQFLTGGDVAGALTRAAASAPGANVRCTLPCLARQHPLLSPSSQGAACVTRGAYPEV